MRTKEKTKERKKKSIVPAYWSAREVWVRRAVVGRIGDEVISHWVTGNRAASHCG